jgi:hypothetical protein
MTENEKDKATAAAIASAGAGVGGAGGATVGVLELAAKGSGCGRSAGIRNLPLAEEAEELSCARAMRRRSGRRRKRVLSHVSLELPRLKGLRGPIFTQAPAKKPAVAGPRTARAPAARTNWQAEAPAPPAPPGCREFQERSQFLG